MERSRQPQGDGIGSDRQARTARFDGSAHRLVAHLVQEGELDEGEREEIAELLKLQNGQEEILREEGNQLMSFKLLTNSPVMDGRGLDDGASGLGGGRGWCAGGVVAATHEAGRSRGPSCGRLVLADCSGGIAGGDFRLCFSSRWRSTLSRQFARVERSAEATGVAVADLARTVTILAGSGSRVKAEAIEAAHWQLESVVPYLPAFWLAGSLSALSCCS